MGKYRSKSGCLTCRNRRVKCDEVHPVCGQCAKKNRGCTWESAHSRFRGYRHAGGTSSAGTTPGGPEVDGETMELEEEDDDEDDIAPPPSGSGSAPPRRSNTRAGQNTETAVDPPGAATAGLQQSSASPYLASPSSATTSGVSVPPQFSVALPIREPLQITRHEAKLVHYYAEYLGRWLDGTDPARQFTLRVPVQVKYCPILLHSIVCFAARHVGDDAAADDAYQRCIALLIERLNLNTATHDDDLLCAIVILRFFEQLLVPSITGSDNEQHLAGSSAILRASQVRVVDPSAPTLREAAFWVYVRQCLYNATINQQPPNIDFSLQLEPLPSAMRDNHPLAVLSVETAWANQMTWQCASVVNFCFDRSELQERMQRMQRWETLWEAVQRWSRERPSTFDPIWTGQATSESVFPEIWFTADWHVVAFGFYHFSNILLLTYKPGPKFAVRTVGSKLSETEKQILEHARQICGSCKSSPATVPCLITLCHTIFIWGPLVSELKERNEIIELLTRFESDQRWPTTWIVNALRGEWGMD